MSGANVNSAAICRNISPLSWNSGTVSSSQSAQLHCHQDLVEIHAVLQLQRLLFQSVRHEAEPLIKPKRRVIVGDDTSLSATTVIWRISTLSRA